MTEFEFKKFLEEWVKDYCRNTFAAGLPGGVKLFLDKAYGYFQEQAGVAAESLGDYSVSLQSGTDTLPGAIMALLHPYRRAGGPK